MPVIYAASTSGVVKNQGSSYTTVRIAVTGSSVVVMGNGSITGQGLIGSTYHIYRVFIAFDTSGITITPISATLSIYMTLTDFSNYVIEDAFGPNLTTNLATTDYDSYGGIAFAKTFTPFNGWTTITFDSVMLADMNNRSIFSVDIRSLNEYTATTPINTEFDAIDFTANVPYITYVQGYNGKIDGVSPTAQSKINGILTSTILNVNGVPKSLLSPTPTPTPTATNIPPTPTPTVPL